jgi:hypothetical protein
MLTEFRAWVSSGKLYYLTEELITNWTGAILSHDHEIDGSSPVCDELFCEIIEFS